MVAKLVPRIALGPMVTEAATGYVSAIVGPVADFMAVSFTVAVLAVEVTLQLIVRVDLLGAIIRRTHKKSRQDYSQENHPKATDEQDVPRRNTTAWRHSATGLSMIH